MSCGIYVLRLTVTVIFKSAYLNRHLSFVWTELLCLKLIIPKLLSQIRSIHLYLIYYIHHLGHHPTSHEWAYDEKPSSLVIRYMWTFDRHWWHHEKLIMSRYSDIIDQSKTVHSQVHVQSHLMSHSSIQHPLMNVIIDSAFMNNHHTSWRLQTQK